MLRLYVVGCGGIGGYLTDMLPMVCTSISLDFLEKNKVDIRPFLRNAGNCVLPSLVTSITLIDGDTFDPRNAIRQGAGAGNKLAQRKIAMDNSMVRQTYLRNVVIDGYNQYVNPSNVGMMIPLKVDPSLEAQEAFKNVMDSWAFAQNYLSATDIPVMFLCVDNVKTRYELSVYAEQFPNVLVINGGNEKTTGHVTVYERRNGEALDPNIYEVFTNIRPDADKRPDEVSCTTVAPKHDQIAITNAMVSNIMLELFTHWAGSGTLDDFVNRGKPCRRNEVVLDVEKLSMTAISHPKIAQPTQGEQQ
jgi:hypothetical protein